MSTKIQKKKNGPAKPVHFGNISNKDRLKEVTFDDHDRKDYLTGFHRRKVARREFAQAKLEEKGKKEKIEQRKFIKLQREAFRDSIIENKKKVEKEMGIIGSDDEDEDEDEDSSDEDINYTPTPKSTELKEEQIKEFSKNDKIIKTTITPMSFDDSDNGDSDSDDDDEDGENDSNSKNIKKLDENSNSSKIPKTKEFSKKKNKGKFDFKKDKDVITADKLKVFDAEAKIYIDDKGRKIKMKRDKGKLIPVVLSERAEEALDQGWKLPRKLRERQKKSWSLSIAKKQRKKAKKGGK
ncbi:hypothetical protein DLAC_09932 [Tieghemostelium lacteum]|uniref:Ribosomal RNA-processing protein 17 n=1 Tax=Tieghemostelium lacteum TaxID=361077 RepID=A0A151Z5N9_TIELA|nr:hypothetical protein DLAC_09932 [Tieghemostelium lacteum]|eukprot:KYQ89273.1 hypothetical protein DLAC_09932 [Tieghemostelium lacteum]